MPSLLFLVANTSTTHRNSSIGLLATIYVFYTIPLTAVSRLVDAEQLDQLFPELAKWSQDLGLEVAQYASGFLTALIWSTFFALCPILFKSIANFGSRATSVASAEFMAFKYFWWFMVFTAFSGPILANMALEGFNDGFAVSSDFRSVVRAIAVTIPSTVSVNWINWIVFRMLVTLPFSYLLQANTFLFQVIGMKCCSRLVSGGGPGGATPYRVFVDSGVVLMCTLSLATASPLVAPACFLYFLVCQPLLRRNLIFVYRPKFDGGGFRWPFVFDMCISCMAVGTILLSGQMGLKEALGPAVLAASALVPIFMFQRGMKRRYGRAFKDAALLQTSLLDGWNTECSSVKKREEFRRFLVDAHKAAYVPVCLAATDTQDFLTAEPAVVVPLSSDPDSSTDDLSPVDPSINESFQATEEVFDRRLSQRGATMRRTMSVLSAARRRTLSRGSLRCDASDDDYSIFSPFGRSSASHVPPFDNSLSSLPGKNE